jgi:pimeloyl-ACP methyl ester carboxylesterase
VRVDEHTITTAHGPVYYRSAPAKGAAPVYLHGIPTSSDDWAAFLERTGGIAPDLPGFGRSGKGGHLDYSLDGLARFVEELLERLEIERTTIVAHDWGAAAAAVLAARRPELVQRIALFNPLPLVEGFRWPGIARWWRRPLIGELVMGSITRRMLTRALRRGSVNPGAWPDQRLASVWEQFDQGTQRAILRLHRGTPELALQDTLGGLRMPALVLWGDRDPWLDPALADAYASRLQRATLERLDAGHWPWLDRPELIERVERFLNEGT